MKHIIRYKMEQKRRQSNIEDLRVEIMRKEKSQKRDEDIYKNINKLNMSKDFLSKKKDELKDNITRRGLEIIELQNKMKDISEGKYDEEFERVAKNESKIFNDKREAALKKRKEAFKEESDKKDMVYRKPKEKENKHFEKDYAYFYKVYNSICETLPSHIRENLRTMPNNKGYVWRGCLFLGDLPAERGQPMIAFEKIRGGITRIYETDDYESRIFEKQGKERKYLISKKPRNNFNTKSRAFIKNVK